ncbi:hypothetical protein JKP75_02325 [Blastococcus sp. TML/M2B]|uniref:hypothetical protein n=1 Tax=unclassified Blastococcus TaxID=2619396 RepID=UPI00190C901F|nr:MULTISPECIES: hypothetical protein [unclassified Blastococcus]MBN1091516.1 hypothetical protein [Blastococcus sp. TML/M2B]MBN1094935.1 hypothetical protein [Blastococcus sp. TML/C7B]
MTTGHDEGANRPETGRPRWIVGADGIGVRSWSGEPVEMPTGRLHAVDSAGFLVGRAVCMAPVVLLDPADWRWPDDTGDEWPRCWICHALTR